ncbi:MAG: hypothetical protein VKJ04_10805, partial [Vampirovibrionales bacterium]|nr:hypothetical protein [Vampirovibrionales bacterium]
MINWMNQLLAPGQKSLSANAPLRNTTPSSFLNPIAPLEGQAGSPQQHNPFMSALKPESRDYKEMYGVNRPLDKPMFLGYRDNKALYGGAKLF